MELARGTRAFATICDGISRRGTISDSRALCLCRAGFVFVARGYTRTQARARARGVEATRLNTLSVWFGEGDVIFGDSGVVLAIGVIVGRRFVVLYERDNFVCLVWAFLGVDKVYENSSLVVQACLTHHAILLCTITYICRIPLFWECKVFLILHAAPFCR